MGKPKRKNQEHKIIKRDTNRIGEDRIWCSCGARCRPLLNDETADSCWEIHTK